ncbi:isoleucine--tRNA ligase [Sphingomonas sabuli]|uniref:Isoleucine--tRNA ligase n=1 Tax=Sphingomonas sabuli TaxID=2764186 RepID=A0A7G9L1I8_9SPHN|nr:isoleucine--tRNA ligase [Sphingomonas sabuli]QNM82487.1 isoleucine--tRNA ligase [Sphingomonas sabuli]
MSDAPKADEGSKPDYRPTVFLPRTDFPMKAGLPQKEPAILARWQEQDLYGQLRLSRSGREQFILHDGPPYANGDIHIGHALNKTLKDMVVRTQTLLGKDAPYVPGWDCHGLPIEWKVEEQYRKKKLNKDEVPVAEFRAECRDYAQHWVDVQREQLKRLGVGGDWDNPYLTMQYDSEATIVSELFKFAESGQLYRGAKPVMWSPVEKTALAEAEIEYEDIVSTQIDVAFEIVESPIPELVGAHAVIWTTTPWTIPVNQAIAYGPDVEYVLYRVSVTAGFVEASSDFKVTSSPAENLTGTYLIGQELADDFAARISREAQGTVILDEVWEGTGSDLAGTVARHPMHHLGGFFAKPRPFLPGDFVTTDQGTGLVHMAPDHGEDDFELCQANGIGPQFAVEGDGKYRADWPWLGGQGSVINAKFNAPDGPICTDLREAGALLAASADFRHSYPHSWRSKAKVIYRCTPQWFIGMDRPLAADHCETFAERRWENEGGAFEGATPTLRQLAMRAIADTRFVPEKGRNRIGSMVEGRPDWVISRQRAWGVPIALFVDRKSGQPLVDAEVNARIVEAIATGGVDAWSPDNAAAFLGNRNPDDYEMVTDILDVWFDSGCTHVFTLLGDRWPDQRWPADLYLEGSDQHRGWFQSSLLESCGTRGRAPYDAVLTHGFTMDSAGKKMSKSLGNTVDPNKVMETYGADIIRLWALSVDFTEDHRIGDEILKGVADQYRKLRNTFRYLLGALDGYDEAAELRKPEDMPELERYMLSRLKALDERLMADIGNFDFNDYTRALTDFCNEDLSAFFFDIRKDSLYCDAPGDPKRQAYRTVLDIMFNRLLAYAAPVLVFTAEEVWQTRWPDRDSIHLVDIAPLPDAWRDLALEDRWSALRRVREQVTEAIEPLRRDKVVRSSLEAEVTLPDLPATPDLLAELFITSAVHRGDTLAIAQTAFEKCGRCWRYLPEVVEDGALCDRCDTVLNGG